MNTSQTTARFEHSPPFAAHRAFGMSTPELTRDGARGLAVEAVRQGAAPVVFLSRIERPFLPGIAMTVRATLAREWASLSFRDPLGRVRQNLPKQVANIPHWASVAFFVVITSHHRRDRKCPKSIRSAVLCLH